MINKWKSSRGESIVGAIAAVFFTHLLGSAAPRACRFTMNLSFRNVCKRMCTRRKPAHTLPYFILMRAELIARRRHDRQPPATCRSARATQNDSEDNKGMLPQGAFALQIRKARELRTQN